jgi:hypothetical protein
MEEIGEELVERFEYSPILPLSTEAEIGVNWMETTPISVDQ